MDDLKPGDLPLFAKQPLEAQEAFEYPGETEALPTFDAELKPLIESDRPEGPEGEKLTSIRKNIARERWRAMARAYATGKFSVKTLAEKFNYTQSNVQSVLSKKWIQDEIARHRDAYSSEVTARIKDAAVDSVEYLHDTILNSEIKHDIRSTNARWFVEKQTGRAHQSVTHQHADLGAFMDLVRGMRERTVAGAMPGDVPVLDITPPVELSPGTSTANAAQVDTGTVAPQRWDSWLNDNLAD